MFHFYYRIIIYTRAFSRRQHQSAVRHCISWLQSCTARNSGPHGADSGPHGADSGPHGADSGPRRADSGPRRADSGPHRADSGPRRADSGPRRADSGPHGEDSGPRVRYCAALVGLLLGPALYLAGFVLEEALRPKEGSAVQLLRGGARVRVRHLHAAVADDEEAGARLPVDD
eukprot:1232690-Pyramimonas_sp.AAC.2